jgi:hypothetical protein
MLKSPKWLVSSAVIVVLLIAGMVWGATSLGGPGYILAGDDGDQEDGMRPRVIPTQVYLVRHAEQTEDRTDLLPVGYDRAALLAERLTRARVTHVCSSHLNRALQTVLPTAEDHGLPVNQLPSPGSTVDGQGVDQSTSSSASIEPMVDFLLDLPPGSVAVCAGHSGTLLAIMAGLGVRVDPNCDYPLDNCVPGTSKEDFPGKQYDDLWMIVPGVATGARDDHDKADERRPGASLVNLRYGDPDAE